MFPRIVNVVYKELIQFGRDRLLAAFILLAPVVQLVLLAQATGAGIGVQPLVVVDLDHSPLSRQLIARLENTGELNVTYYIEDMAEMRRLLDQGTVRLGVVIPAGFAREASSGRSQAIQIIADATNTVAASTSIAAAGGAITRFSTDLAESYGLAVPEFIDFRTNVRFNPEMNIRDFTIPAQLGFIVYQVTLAVASLGLARERELGTLEQLMVTPLRRFELALGKAIPAIAIGQVNFVAMYAISRLLFHVPMNGSIVVLMGMTFLFIVAVANWGVAISSISRTQQQAILFVFIQAMVDMTLSGYLVAVQNMPWLLRTISYVSPLQHYMTIVRGVMLKGAGLDSLWPEALAIVGLIVALGLLALRGVLRQLD